MTKASAEEKGEGCEFSFKHTQCKYILYHHNFDFGTRLIYNDITTNSIFLMEENKAS